MIGTIKITMIMNRLSITLIPSLKPCTSNCNLHSSSRFIFQSLLTIIVMFITYHIVKVQFNFLRL